MACRHTTRIARSPSGRTESVRRRAGAAPRRSRDPSWCIPSKAWHAHRSRCRRVATRTSALSTAGSTTGRAGPPAPQSAAVAYASAAARCWRPPRTQAIHATRRRRQRLATRSPATRIASSTIGPSGVRARRLAGKDRKGASGVRRSRRREQERAQKRRATPACSSRSATLARAASTITVLWTSRISSNVALRLTWWSCSMEAAASEPMAGRSPKSW
mmetsp:Transcript_87145/g.221991  ORF Transcript_87145/g.221991 Transcript_87145/m.221991 type:complete len:217 (-) Transcript_87145:565-1215(-)